MKNFKFIMIPLNIEKKNQLNSTAKLIYYHLLFRMRASIKQGTKYFYSNLKKSHYVIYRIKELAQNTGSSRGAVILGLRKLEKYGLVTRVRKFHRTLIFLPKYQRDSPYQSTKNVKSKNWTSTSTEVVPLLKSKNKRKNKVCVKTPVRSPKKKSNNKLVKAFRSNWNANNNDIIKLNQLSSNFSTKLILKAIKITKYKEFKTTPLNFITGVIRKLVLEAKEPNHKPKKVKPKKMFRITKPKRKQPSIRTLTRFYDSELVRYAVKLAKASHKVIRNRFNYIAGILFRFKKLGITTVSAAKAYEINPNYNNGYNQNQIHQRNLALEHLLSCNQKTNNSNNNNNSLSSKAKKKAAKIMYKIRGNRTPRQWFEHEKKLGKLTSVNYVTFRDELSN